MAPSSNFSVFSNEIKLVIHFRKSYMFKNVTATP